MFIQDYLRYRVSAYNISNSVGLHIGYFIYWDAREIDPYFYAPALQTGGKWLFESQARDVLRYNARMPYREFIHYNRNGITKDVYQSLVEYWKREPANEDQYRGLLYGGSYASQVFGHKEGQHLIGDFDKDGKDDIAFFEPGDGSSWGSNSMYIRTRVPYSVWPPGPLQNVHPGLWHPYPGWLYEQIEPIFGIDGEVYVGDFNGDKLDDFAFVKSVNDPNALSISSLLKDPSAPSGYRNDQVWGLVDDPKGSLLFIGVGHFTSETKDDFVFYDLKENKVIIADRFGERWETFPFSQPPYSYRIEDGKFYIGDFDGNGGDDIAFFAADNTMHIALHSAAGFAVGREWEPNAFGHTDGQFFIGDFDGDRRSDFAFFEPADDSMHIRLNQKIGFVDVSGWSSNAFGNKGGKFLVGDINGDGKSDFAFVEPGPVGSAPYYTRIYTRLTLDQINSIVRFTRLPETYKTTSDTSGCPAGYNSKFSFDARIRSGKDISDITVEVRTLTKPNVLLNADFGPAGDGARVTVPLKDDYSDGLLTTPYEYVDVPFAICQLEKSPFVLFVDVLGRIR